MEYQKITNLLSTTIDEIPRFITKKWVEVYDQLSSADRYKPNKQIRLKTSMLRSDLCDYSDAYIVVTVDITLTKSNKRGIIDIKNRFLAFKNNAPFTNCISKINNVLIGNAEDLDILMPMYNLLEYSKNYRKTTGRDEPNNPPDVNYHADPITNSESFKYKSSITGKTSNVNNNTEREHKKTKKNLEIVVPLKYLSNFWRTLGMSLINCEVSLTLTWSENCLLTDITTSCSTSSRR